MPTASSTGPRISKTTNMRTLALLFLAIVAGGTGCSDKKPGGNHQSADAEKRRSMTTHGLQVHLDIEPRVGERHAHLSFENQGKVPVIVPAYVLAATGTAFFQICHGGGTLPCEARDLLKYIGPYQKADVSITQTLAPSEKVETTVRIDHLYDFSKASGEIRARYAWTCGMTVGATEERVELTSNEVVFRK